MAEDSAGLPANPAGARANPNPAQHVGPEVSEILLTRRHPMIMQVAHLAPSQPAPLLNFTRDDESSSQAR